MNINVESEHIKIEGHVGKWYVIDEAECTNPSGEKEMLFQLEHETYGDEAAHLIVRANGKIVLDDVWNGYSDLDEACIGWIVPEEILE